MIIASRTVKIRRQNRTVRAMEVTHKSATGEVTVALLSVPAGRQIVGATMGDEDAMAFLEMHALEPLRDPLQPHAFSVGDVVRLKSGGHRMTVIKLRTSDATCADPTAGNLQEVDVAWSQMCANTGNSIETDTLDIAVIESAPDVLPHEREFSF